MYQLSPSEKKGVLIIGFLLLIGFFIQWIQPSVTKPKLYDYSVQDSIFFSALNDTLPVIKESSEPINIKTANKKRRNKQTLKYKSIDINKASKTELTKLPRIGESTAENIIEYRRQNGNFIKIEDIQNVKRIGPKTFEQLKPYIFVTDKPAR